MTSSGSPIDGYMPPRSAEELLERWALGERYFQGAALENADLQDADLENADLGRSNLSGANLSRAMLSNVKFYKANLRGAVFCEANLEWAYLTHADATGCDFSNARLSRSRCSSTCFKDAVLTGANLFASRVTADTYIQSEWSPDYLKELVSRRLEVVDLNLFPVAVQDQFSDSTGLTMWFSTRLTPFDRFLVDGVIFGVLGRDTNCRVVEFREREGAATLRLMADDLKDHHRCVF